MGLISNGTTIFDNGAFTSSGSMKLVSSATASSSSTIDFTLGDYKEYQFYFVNIHASSNAAYFQFNVSTDNGSNFNVTKTSTSFAAYHNEADTDFGLGYETGNDLAQSSNYQNLTTDHSIDNDASASGSLIIFNPSSSVFVKNFIANFASFQNSNYQKNQFTAGYANTSSILTNIRFKFSIGNIDAGTILMYGIN